MKLIARKYRHRREWLLAFSEEPMTDGKKGCPGQWDSLFSCTEKSFFLSQ